MDTLLNVATRSLIIEIKAEDKLCNVYCPYFTIGSTGLIDEWYPACTLFPYTGKWRKHTMKRAKECLKAEKVAATKCVRT